ncbi:MAG: extracellular solute-binding protein [Chloroflexi bacterium]|nr:extracellular solute-binding protein [Chloroflexota bacterium]
MSRYLKLLALLLSAVLLIVACGGGDTPAAPTPAPAPVEEAPAPVEEAPAPAEPVAVGDAVFFSTQFVPVEEQETFRRILAEGGFDVTGSEEGPLIDLVLAGSQAGQGTIDVIGALHGTYPPLARADAMRNLIDLAEDLSDSRDFAPAFLETGLLGTDDFLNYIPWMQATYIMAAHNDALPYLPAGADLDNLTWEQFAEWCQNILDETSEPRCGLPHAGLFNRFLQGYMWPSFTGGMVGNFRSNEAIAMMEWARDSLWPTIHPQSINYSFMQEALLSGEVWVAFDHTARLIDAFNADPDNFIAFAAPAGPAGRGFMPVVVGLGIPADAPNPAAGEAVIEFLTRPDVQEAVLKELGFFPVVGGVDFSDLPAGVAIEAAAVTAQANAPDALPALLPVGLGERGGEINQIYRNAFDRIVLNGEEITAVLDEEGNNLATLMNETGAPCWAPDAVSDGPCPVAPLGEATAAPAAPLMVEQSPAVFFSTQFVPVEEQEIFRSILADGGFDVTGSEEGPLLDLVLAGSQAGSGTIDVAGALHGTFPPLASADAMSNLIDLAEDLQADRDIVPAFLETGLLGSDDFLYYVPWMQATYIMAAHNDALAYLPAGADLNALTWEQFGEWCQNLLAETGEPRCGLPHAGLFNRFLQGYMWPSFTGGMVSTFQSDEAAAMLEWARDSLWPAVHPQSINYAFMQEPLLAGEVWVAFDHTARLINAFNAEPDTFVAFPAPAGPAGRGFMPVVVGLGIPADAPDPEAGAAVIEYLTRPVVQERILKELGFFPVVGGVDFSDLPAGVALEAGAVTAQANAPDALPALLPVGLGERGGEINQIFRNAFDRVVLNGEDIATVLAEEGANLQALMDDTGAACWAPDPPSDGPCQVQ